MTNVDDTSISLVWDAPPEDNSDEDDIEGYSVEFFSPDLRSGWLLAAEKIRGTKYTLTGLKTETRYVFVVRARNSHGIGKPSPVSKVVKTSGFSTSSGGQQLNKVRSELTDLEVKIRSVKAINSTAVSLDWTVVGDRDLLEGYYLWFKSVVPSDDDDRFNMVTVWGGKRTRFVLKELQKFATYEMFLVPFYKTVEGSPSNIKSVNTLEDGECFTCFMFHREFKSACEAHSRELVPHTMRRFTPFSGPKVFRVFWTSKACTASLSTLTQSVSENRVTLQPRRHP